MSRSRDQVEIVQLAFPGAQADELAEVVRSLGGVARVGTDEKRRAAIVTFAQLRGRATVEDARTRWGLVRVGRDGFGFDLTAVELADRLGIPGSGIVVDAFEPGDDRLGDGWRAVLVLPAHEREYRPLGKDVAGSHIEVREAHGWHLVTWVPAAGATPTEDHVVGQLAGRTALGGPDRGVLLLVDSGHTNVLDVVRGEIDGGRHWPADLWPVVHKGDLDDVEPARELVAELVADLVPQHADDAFEGWGADPVRRRAAFRGHPVDLPEVVAALGLPPETLEVLAGTSTLPATTHEATSLGRAAAGGMLDATAASRFPVVEAVSNIAGIVIAAVVLLLGRDAVPTWAWWGAIVIGILSVLAFATQVWAFRRRRSRARS